jgi:hypothetical protein
MQYQIKPLTAERSNAKYVRLCRVNFTVIECFIIKSDHEKKKNADDVNTHPSL